MLAGQGPVVMVVQQTGSYHTQLTAGLGSVLEEADLPLLVHVWGASDGGPPASLVRLLREGDPRALVLSPLIHRRSDTLLRELLATLPDLPVLSLGTGSDRCSVRADNAAGMRLVADHLVRDCGATTVLAVRGIAHHPDSQERQAALDAELARLGVPADRRPAVDGDYDRETTYHAVRGALALRPDIDAIAAFSDRSALGAMDAVHALDLRVPEDVVVTGFDDEDFAGLCRPGLTTVTQNAHDQGRQAGRQLLRLLAGQEPGHLRTPVALVVRGSTERGTATPTPPDEATAQLMWNEVASLDAALVMSREFMSCRTVEEIVEKLAVALPLLGVMRGFLVLRNTHEGADDDGHSLIMSVHDGTIERKTVDASLDLGRWLAHHRQAYPTRGTLVVQPLSVGDVEIGHLVIEQAPRRPNSHVTQALGIDLSRAIDTVNRTLRLEAEVAARRAAQDALVYQARHDPLTGLANRTAFVATADPVVAAGSAPGGDGAALLTVDIDRFKDVNDSLGHAVGNMVLCEVADRLRAVDAGRGLVCRLSGDTFAVLVPGAGDVEAALEVAETALARLRDHVVLDGVSLEIDASIGVARAPEHAGDTTSLLRKADLARHRAKADHTGVSLFDPAEDAETPHRLELFGELRRALTNSELVVYYQPITQVGTGMVSGVEALVRWEHPVRGLLPPADFLEIAEQTGLIHPITSYVLDHALADCRRWLDSGLSLPIAVNLSARRLTDVKLAQEVSRLLAHHGVPASNLVLEITESAAMADPHRALDVLHALRDLGIQLSVDDFGTGHASLAYLSRLPVTSLKIDRAFVQTMESDQANMTIVRSILELARSLGLGVVAEGIETSSAYETLSSYEGLKAQGYWLARPVPAGDVPGVVTDIQRRLADPATVPRPRAPIEAPTLPR